MPRQEDFHFIGQANREPTGEQRHDFLCAYCGQPVDKRDLGAVSRHAVRGHQPVPGLEPLAAQAASRLAH
jgi:hypothetical protein